MKKQFVCALGAAVVLGFCGAASAGGQLHVTNGESVDLPLTTAGIAVSYAFVDNGYVADVQLQGFLFCNHVDTQVAPIALVARHDAWVFGSNVPGTVAPVPGITDISYDGQSLNLTTDSNTQCFQANRHGQGISDLHHIFVGGFDLGAVTSNTPNSSAVLIAIDHIPANSDDTFRYTLTVLIADPNGQQPVGQAQTHSLGTTEYYLNEGYDTSVFSNCNIVPGQSMQASTTITRACNVRTGVNVSQLNGMVPVVAAALFTGPDVDETDFGDNLAFGYPAVTPQ